MNSMVIFHSYVSLPEETIQHFWDFPMTLVSPPPVPGSTEAMAILVGFSWEEAFEGCVSKACERTKILGAAGS